jgi:hypothetical protein
MLYDPNWNRTRTPLRKLLTVKRLRLWLETMPPTMSYVYYQHDGCLLAQYLQAHGHNASVGQHCLYTDTEYRSLPRELNNIARMQPHTFGAALQRCHRGFFGRIAARIAG